MDIDNQRSSNRNKRRNQPYIPFWVKYYPGLILIKLQQQLPRYLIRLPTQQQSFQLQPDHSPTATVQLTRSRQSHSITHGIPAYPTLHDMGELGRRGLEQPPDQRQQPSQHTAVSQDHTCYMSGQSETYLSSTMLDIWAYGPSKMDTSLISDASLSVLQQKWSMPRLLQIMPIHNSNPTWHYESQLQITATQTTPKATS